MGGPRNSGILINTMIDTNTDTAFNGLVKGQGGKMAQAVAGSDYVDPSDPKLTDNRTPADLSVTYGKVANALKSKTTASSTIDLSANGIGQVTLSGNTSFTFTGFELNKSYLLIVTANGYTPSFANAAKHVLVEGNAALGTAGVFYINLLCIDATSGSEKLLTTIMKGA
ncbi:MAG TPA: hypothetical protein DHV48_01100 [Prolixibacteraceae bacterium]|nr:hypothetical protein [Prolixibacteraceae bacterium]